MPQYFGLFLFLWLFLWRKRNFLLWYHLTLVRVLWQMVCVECVNISQSTKRHSEGTYPSLNIDRSTALKTSQHIEEPNISINKQLLINISRTFLWTTAVYPFSPSSHRTSIKGSRSRAIKQALITMKSNQKAITRLEKIIKFSLLTTRSTCK